MPSVYIVPSGANAQFFGKVCNISSALVSGSLTLEATGSSCEYTQAARYNFSQILVYSTGKLLTSASTPTVYVNARVCLFPGGTAQSTGFVFNQNATAVSGTYYLLNNSYSDTDTN